MKRTIPPVTRCALCAHFKESARPGVWFCALHNHVAEERGGCTWGADAEEAAQHPLRL